MFGRSRTVVVLVAVAVVGLGVAGLFVVDVDSTEPEPVQFERTVSVGLALEAQYDLDDEVHLPEVQTFYSQFEYVVGYYGVETFVDALQRDGHTQQFGYPQAIYVTAYDETVALSADGYPIPETSPGSVPAEDAWYVLDSEARTPNGETVVPFGDREAAESFVADYGGEVRDWDHVREASYDVDDAALVRDRVDDQHAGADALVDDAAALLEREPAVVVGEDVETIQEGIDRAPSNATVVVPAGTYEEAPTVTESVTLRGDGDVTIRGDGTGSVLTIAADDVAVTGVDVAGVGDAQSGTDQVPDHHGAGEAETWDDELEDHYGGGDAGVVVEDANRTVLADVAVETPANGVIITGGDDVVVRNVTVDGNESWRDGGAGLSAIRTDGVIEDSTFSGGQDGVYLHRSPEAVVRDTEFEGNLLGVHLMHTSDALIAGNTLREQASTGIYVMTGPERVGIVDNDVRETDTDIVSGGSDSYVADNVVEGTALGIRMDATTSIYEGNVIAGNVVGVHARQPLPGDRVANNDFVGNYDHAMTGSGPLHRWGEADAGNYWQGSTALAAAGDLDATYVPTDPVDERLHVTDGTPTLAHSPASLAIGGFQEAVPGMRAGSVVESNPQCEPTNPDRLERTAWADHAWTCDDGPTDAGDATP